MKTGRIRTKTPPPTESAAPSPQPPAEPLAPSPPGTGMVPGAAGIEARRGPVRGTLLWVFIAIVAVIACLAIVVLVRGGGGAEEWVPVTHVSGDWTAGVTVFGPQVAIEQRWQIDCPNSGNTLLQSATCVMRDTSTYQDQPVDDHTEYAYNIYYEETSSQVYEAQGTEFATTSLRSDDHWEGNRHTVTVEELDKESCTQTEYTVWVEDPSNTAQEIEVYLSDCEVWNHVTVTERVYEQAPWCQCQVTTMAGLGQLSDQGTGLSITWPQPTVPTGGHTEQSFSGRVTFVGGDYTYSLTTEDWNQYQGYLTGQYYIGVRNKKPLAVTDNPPQK